MHGVDSWTRTDRESVTKLYVRPAPPRFTPRPVHASKPPRDLRGIGFLSACVVAGVVIGMVLAMQGRTTVAADSSPAPAVATAHVIVTPIIEEPRAVTVEPPAKIIELPPPPVPHHHHHAAKTTGTLMLSAKPPCAIAIDGRPTGLTTPQRTLSLPVGRHEVTLTNDEQGVRRTVGVTIAADRPTRLVQDLMK